NGIAGNRSLLTSDRNLQQWNRWLRFKCGATAEEIAKADGVSLRAVEEAVLAGEVYRQAHSLDVANGEVYGTVTRVMPNVERSLNRGLTAKNRRVNKKGKTIVENDLNTQLRAVGEVTKLIEAVQPKSGNTTNINASAQSASVV